MAEDGALLEVAPRAAKTRTAIPSNPTLLLQKSPLDHDKPGTRSLVARERSFAFERRRRRLYELVCANGLGKRPSFGSDAVPQELDPGALCRARSLLLAGRDARSAPDRPHGSHGDAVRGAGKGSGPPARAAPR